jgi:hypothetical protein
MIGQHGGAKDAGGSGQHTVLPVGPMLEQISIACASHATNRLGCARRRDRLRERPYVTIDRYKRPGAERGWMAHACAQDRRHRRSGAGALQKRSSLPLVDAAEPAFSNASAYPNSSDRTRSPARRCGRSDVAPTGDRITKTGRRVLLALPNLGHGSSSGAGSSKSLGWSKAE